MPERATKHGPDADNGASFCPMRRENRDGLAVTDRLLIAYGIIIFVVVSGAVALWRWRRRRRGGRSPEPHLRIDLVNDSGEPPPQP